MKLWKEDLPYRLWHVLLSCMWSNLWSHNCSPNQVLRTLSAYALILLPTSDFFKFPGLSALCALNSDVPMIVTAVIVVLSFDIWQEWVQGEPRDLPAVSVGWSGGWGWGVGEGSWGQDLCLEISWAVLFHFQYLAVIFHSTQHSLCMIRRSTHGKRN